MTITIDLSEDTVATLIERARAEGRSATDLAAEAVSERFGAETFLLDAETAEGLRRGFADLDAGRTLSLQEAQAEFGAAFATRFGKSLQA